jgi:hypothetical protein
VCSSDLTLLEVNRDGSSVGKSNPGQDLQIDDDVTNRL